jgi:hypothetical protein
MHTVDLGIWVHLLRCIAVKIDTTVRKHGILAANKVNRVWDNLSERANELDGDECMFKLNHYKGNVLKMLLNERNAQKFGTAEKKKRKAQAWEHHLLMNVCASVCHSVQLYAESVTQPSSDTLVTCRQCHFC